MTAKEMFEKEGFTRKENDFYIVYENEDLESIVFDKFRDIITTTNYCINKNILKAIIKQTEELGWYENDKESI